MSGVVSEFVWLALIVAVVIVFIALKMVLTHLFVTIPQRRRERLAREKTERQAREN